MLDRSLTSLLAAFAVLSGMSGCGGGQSPVVVRVGGASLSKERIDHWTATIERGAIVTDPASSSRQSPKEQAVAFLISSEWLIGEVAARGLTPSARQLRRGIEEQEQSVPDGRADFRAGLAATGQTVRDVELEVEARWASSTVRRLLASQADRLAKADVTAAAIAAYYRSHLSLYRLKERRYYDLIERIGSVAAARGLARRLGSGKRFAQAAVEELPMRPRAFDAPQGEGAVLRAVFTARVGVIVGPLPLRHGFALFVLRRIAPPRTRTLAEVRRSIAARLHVEDRRRAFARLTEEYRAKWLAKTDCSPGYVIQACRQYRGPMRPASELLGS